MGLQYFNARYYDPDLGQFLSPDTLVPDPTNVFSWNRYMYTIGNPMRYTDPSGHDLKDVITTFVDFAQGVGAQVGYNNTVVALPSEVNSLAPQSGESTAKQAGRFIGNVVTAVQGVAEISGGAGLGGTGVAACTTGVGCVATAPAVITASAVIAHGGTVATIGAVNAGTQLANAVMAMMGKGDSSNNSSLVYESSPKHHQNAKGNISQAPTNGQSTLDNSFQIKSTSPRRIGVDPSNGEFVVFDQTQKGIFHGHVRTWEQLTQEMRNVLTNAGQVTLRGKIK